MYYKGVNRGLTFTKPGRYAIGFIFLMGLLAVLSGLNAFFLFLGIGLGMLIISGLLSEKQIRHVTGQPVEFRQADAGRPFTMRVRLANTHARLHLYGIASLGFATRPNLAKRRWPTPRLQSFTLKVPAGDAVSVDAHVSGLERGVYRTLHFVHKTSYPFGLMEKFKLEESACHVRVVPPLREELSRTYRAQLRAAKSRLDADGDFHGHRPHEARDSLALVDWRKSARAPHAGLLAKRFSSPNHARRAHVRVAWGALAASATAQAYEDALADVRTLCDVLRDESFHVRLFLEGLRAADGHEEALDLLASLPGHALRGEAKPSPPRDESDGNAETLGLRYTPGQGVSFGRGAA